MSFSYFQNQVLEHFFFPPDVPYAPLPLFLRLDAFAFVTVIYCNYDLLLFLSLNMKFLSLVIFLKVCFVRN